MKFLRRKNISDYIENQTVTIGAGGGSDTVENLLIGTSLEAFEFEIEGKRYVFFGIQPAD